MSIRRILIGWLLSLAATCLMPWPWWLAAAVLGGVATVAWAAED